MGESEKAGMSKKYFPIYCIYHERFSKSIASLVQNSSSTILQQRWKNSENSALAELSLALATKFEIIKIIKNRLNAHIHNLYEDFKERPDEVQWHITGVDGQPSAYRPRKRALPFEIVADLDAWIFELRSTYEILYAFMKEFSSRILDKKVNKEKALKAILHDKGYSSDWIDFLNDERNYFIHKTAPWFSIEVTGGKPMYEIVILKVNTHNLNNPDEYTMMRHMNLFLRDSAKLKKHCMSGLLKK